MTPRPLPDAFQPALRSALPLVWAALLLMYVLLFVCMFVPSIVLTLPRALGY